MQNTIPLVCRVESSKMGMKNLLRTLHAYIVRKKAILLNGKSEREILLYFSFSLDTFWVVLSEAGESGEPCSQNGNIICVLE